MLLHFRKRFHTSNRSISIWKKFRIKHFILVAAAVEVSLSTVSSAAAYSSSFTFSLYYSRGFPFLYFYQTIQIFIEWNSFISVIFCFTFLLHWYTLFRRFLSCLVNFVIFLILFCLCQTSSHTFLIGCLKLPTNCKYQQQNLRLLWIAY